MMSPELIRELSREAGEAAEHAGDRPFVYWRGDPVTNPFPYPNIGDYRPEGWEMVDTLFADATGMGGETEPALTIGQLTIRVLEIRDSYEELGLQVGFAIVETGQFQVVIGVFEVTTIGGVEERERARERAELAVRLS